MSILLGVESSAPPAPPEPPSRALTGLIQTWTGWDGSTFLLTDPTSPVRLKQGVRGLHMPPAQRFSDVSPAIAGSRYRGSRVQEREVFWPIAIYGDGTAGGFFAADRAFWRTMRQDRPGTWTVIDLDGTSRSLLCRFLPSSGDPTTVDPSASGWASYGVNLVADEKPFWQGEPVTRHFQASPAAEFFGGPAKGPSFHISSGSTLANARINNPGDVQAYPTWTVEGPCTDATVGIDGLLIEVPFPLLAGQKVTIDTDPAAYTATREDGTDVTALLGRSEFAPIPAGDSVALTLTMTGAGIVSVHLVPQYYRAW